MAKLLLVEDDPLLGRALEELLIEEGYDVSRTNDGEVGLHLAGSGFYDALILDVMIPNLDGFDVMRSLRGQRSSLPVLMLTARDSIADRVKGLDVGADDYLVKPFATTELLARVRALLRRQGAEMVDPDSLAIGGITLELSSRELRAGGQTYVLPPKEAALLELFMRYPRQVLTREQLMDRLWGFEGDVLENTLETYVSKLRKRLECIECPTIQTVRGLGYRLQIKS